MTTTNHVTDHDAEFAELSESAQEHHAEQHRDGEGPDDLAAEQD